MGGDGAKEAILQAVVNHMLEHGTSNSTLRDLAKAAQSNNRMLLYYFGTKERLVAAAIDAGLTRYPLLRDLDQLLTTPGVELGERLRGTWSELAKVQNRPYIRLLFEAVVQASRDGTNARLVKDFNRKWVITLADALELHSVPRTEARRLARRIIAFWRGLQFDLVTGGSARELAQVHNEFVDQVLREVSCVTSGG